MFEKSYLQVAVPFTDAEGDEWHLTMGSALAQERLACKCQGELVSPTKQYVSQVQTI